MLIQECECVQLWEWSLKVDGSPERTPHTVNTAAPYSERCEKNCNPSLLSWVLIYFHINPSVQYLTRKVSNITQWCRRTDPCVSWHQWSEAGQYCAVCWCDVTPVACRDGHGQATGPGNISPEWQEHRPLHYDTLTKHIQFRWRQPNNRSHTHTHYITPTRFHLALYTLRNKRRTTRHEEFHYWYHHHHNEWCLATIIHHLNFFYYIR